MDYRREPDSFHTPQPHSWRPISKYGTPDLDDNRLYFDLCEENYIFISNCQIIYDLSHQNSHRHKPKAPAKESKSHICSFQKPDKPGTDRSEASFSAAIRKPHLDHPIVYSPVSH